MATCQRDGCENEIPPSFHVRKWCSTNCCKRACDERKRGSCVECGAVLAVASGYGDNNGKTGLCRKCWARGQEDHTAERLQWVADMYRSGMSHREIADALGWQAASNAGVIVTAARRRGFLNEYRYDAVRRRNSQEGEAA
jgi:hypothetical protein